MTKPKKTTKTVSLAGKVNKAKTAKTKVEKEPVQPVTNVPVPEEKPEEKPAQKSEKQELKRYRFIAKCSNLNISNVIFNNTKVIIYEVNAPSYEAAYKDLQEAGIKMFNGNVENYNTFMKSVFGTGILVEILPWAGISEAIAKLQ